MKNITNLILLFFFFGILSLQAQNRNALWLRGIGATSIWWNNTIQGAAAGGYNLNNISTYDYAPHMMSISASADQMNTQIASYSNVLGIGHDGGGIVLRQMAKSPTTTLSALILDGVPNNGSAALEKMLIDVGTNQIQNFINEILSFKSGAQSCQACQTIEAFNTWVTDINVHAERYREYTPGSPVIQNLGTPTIPYAVIWGNEDEADGLILTRLLGSRAEAVLQGDDSGYLECFRDEINDRLTILNDQLLNAQATSILSMASASTQIFSAIKLTNGVPEVDQGAIAGALNDFLNSIKTRITEIRKIDLELAEVLECELVHQALNLKWNFLVSSQVIATPLEVELSSAVCCEECYSEPDPQIQGYCFSVCFTGPSVPDFPGFCYAESSQTVYYYTQQPHDGLLTRDEQLLSGAAKTYEAKKTNHFQEQFWSNAQIRQPMIDLFNGNAGTAFVVPL